MTEGSQVLAQVRGFGIASQDGTAAGGLGAVAAMGQAFNAISTGPEIQPRLRL
jgi:hypothetical protein